jgi:eukaryotic-like serine/threonine-protein kinase
MNRLWFLAAGVALLRMAEAADAVPARFELAVVDLQGQKKILGTLPGTVVAPRISPDGLKVAFEQVDDPPADPKAPPMLRPYVAELNKLDKPRALQPTLLTNVNRSPEWSLDRDWIVFAASGNGSDAIFRQKSDGWIQPKYIVDGLAPEAVHEGWLLLFLTVKAEKDFGVALLDMNTSRILQRFDAAGSAQYSGELSKDGQWIAYTSDETGRPEVFLQSLKQQNKRVQLTRQGGSNPQWSPEGTRLYFDQGGRLYSINVSMEDQSPRATSEPVVLPVMGFVQSGMRRQYDLMPDGKGFLMLFPASK